MSVRMASDIFFVLIFCSIFFVLKFFVLNFFVLIFFSFKFFFRCKNFNKKNTTPVCCVVFIWSF